MTEDNDDRIHGTADLPELPDRLRELSEIASWAAERGAKVRLTYLI